MTIKDDPDLVLHASGWDYPPIPKPEESFFAITGNESQVLTVRLEPGDMLKGEPGSMMFLTSGMKQTIGCGECWARCCTGEECCTVNFINGGDLNAYAALTPNFPTAKVVPVDLSAPEVGGKLICQRGSYMASYGDVTVHISWDFNLGRCCCGGMGLIRQKLKGTGTVFLTSSGTMVQKVLKEGETILVDTNCLVAYSRGCSLDIRRTGGVLGMVGGGEGFFNAAVTGPGLVIVQSMNEATFLLALAAPKLYRR